MTQSSGANAEFYRRAAEVNHSHADVTGGWLRPAVFGLTDGLVSNVALISGVAGASVSAHTVILTGIAGLVAGAFSMATGEFISVTSQADLTRKEIEKEKLELTAAPEAEEAELALVFKHRGLPDELAREVARQLSLDPEMAWRTHVREELGIDPDDLPSPWLAAFSSFLSFSVGALIPLLPYLLGANSLTVALIAAAVFLFAAGAATGKLTERSPLIAGARQLGLGALSAGVTFLVGHAIGASIH